MKGVIFDMDGVLSDSETLIRAAAMEMFRSVLGIEVLSTDFEPFVGRGEDRYLRGVADRYRVPIDVPMAKAITYEIYNRLSRGRLKAIDGAVPFLRRCQAVGLKTALATGADRDRADATLMELGLAGDFCAVVTGTDVTRQKPAPDIFVAAAAAMGLETHRCVVIEDALVGVQAAKSAGSMCLGLATSFGTEALSEAGADWVAPSFATIPDDLLGALKLVC